jgi:hypothetical protein
MFGKLNAGNMLARLAPVAQAQMPQGGLGAAMMPPQDMMAAPGGGGGFDERTGTYARAPQGLGRLFRRPRIDFETGQPLPPGGGMSFGQAMGAGRGIGGMLAALRNMMPEAQPAVAPTMPAPMPIVEARPDMPPIGADIGLNPLIRPGQPVDPNRALNDFNARIGDIYRGGGQMDMDMIRAQQANLRNLQLDRNSTQEQHDMAYRSALDALRARYPDAFGA